MTSRQLDVIYWPQQVTTPAGTPIAAPLSTPAAWSDYVLAAVRLFIPPGHRGVTGLSLQLAGMSLIPWGVPPVWVLGDDVNFDWDVGVEVGSGLTVVTYNTGAFPHTHYLYFKLLAAPAGGGAAVTAAPATGAVPSGLAAPAAVTVGGPPPVSALDVLNSTAAPVDVGALAQLVADLQARVATLEQRVAALDGSSPATVAVSSSTGAPAPVPSVQMTGSGTPPTSDDFKTPGKTVTGVDPTTGKAFQYSVIALTPTLTMQVPTGPNAPVIPGLSYRDASGTTVLDPGGANVATAVAQQRGG